MAELTGHDGKRFLFGAFQAIFGTFNPLWILVCTRNFRRNLSQLLYHLKGEILSFWEGLNLNGIPQRFGMDKFSGPVWQVNWANPRFDNVLASCSHDR